MKSPWLRGGFLALAVAAAVWAVAANWDDVVRAVRSLPAWMLALGLAGSFAYVWLTMLSWRSIITSGSAIEARVAARIFFSSQVAKYLPGGVWNFVAAAEVGRDYAISRRRSVTSLMVAVAISIITGMLLAILALLFGPGGLWQSYWWVAAALPVGIAVLTPPVLNRVLGVVLRLARREGLEAPLTWSACGRCAAWALAAWVVIGTQVWLMLTCLGARANLATFFLAVGGYALGWTVGFLVVFIPAGAGVREVALGAVLAGVVDSGALVVVVLLVRLLTTVADVALGVGASLAMRAGRK
ncbi:MAG: lysylphosphatidylglycerol synthase domain-containing protein [Actinomycetaceae bacterium]|nr:lysylphosphatidylglycerol synthase domain-containing protein [Actinomycetaceae bacterium]